MTDKKPPLKSIEYPDLYPSRVHVVQSRITKDWLVYRGWRLVAKFESWNKAIRWADDWTKQT